jgi:hypothetical protein
VTQGIGPEFKPQYHTHMPWKKISNFKSLENFINLFSLRKIIKSKEIFEGKT